MVVRATSSASERGLHSGGSTEDAHPMSRRRLIGTIFIGCGQLLTGCVDGDKQQEGQVAHVGALREANVSNFSFHTPMNVEFVPLERFQHPDTEYIISYPNGWEVQQLPEGEVKIVEPPGDTPFIYVELFETDRTLEEQVMWSLTRRQEFDAISDLQGLSKAGEWTTEPDQFERMAIETASGDRMLVVDLRYLIREQQVHERIGVVQGDVTYTVSLFSSVRRFTEDLNEVTLRVFASFQPGET